VVLALFADEHDALRAALRRFVDERIRPHAAEWDTAGGLPAGVRRAVGDLGYLAAGQPGVSGRTEDLLAAVVVAEEFGRAANGGVADALLAQGHLGPPLLAGGSGRMRELHSAAVAGERLVAAALSGDVSATPLPGAHGARGGRTWRIDGRFPLVTNAASASAVVVLAEGSQGPMLLLVDGADPTAAAPGGRAWLAARPTGILGHHGGDVADLHFDAAVGTELRAGDAALRRVHAQLDHWWLVSAALVVAEAWDAWEGARRYALDRTAFGRPIGRFQVNRHRLAELAARLTAARQLVHDTAWRMTRGVAEPGQAAGARHYALRTAAAAADACLQLHGGYGYTMDYGVQRTWRDSRTRSHVDGGERRLLEALTAPVPDVGVEAR
jgi:alkylation response protein AidB-like acyl-CoA dehydrogenase